MSCVLRKETQSPGLNRIRGLIGANHSAIQPSRFFQLKRKRVENRVAQSAAAEIQQRAGHRRRQSDFSYLGSSRTAANVAQSQDKKDSDGGPGYLAIQILKF